MPARRLKMGDFTEKVQVQIIGETWEDHGKMMGKYEQSMGIHPKHVR
jgi:hypothetical protein